MGRRGLAKARLSRAVAQTLGYRHLDTGAMYPRCRLEAHHDHIPLHDEEAVARLARSADLVVEGGVVAIDGHDVTQAIRTPEVDKLHPGCAAAPGFAKCWSRVSARWARTAVSSWKGATSAAWSFRLRREDLSRRLRRRARTAAARMMRRMPAARRSSRRSQKPFRRADLSDKTRAASPLALVPGAVHIDTTDMPIDRVVDHVLALVKQRLG
jgi:cytidylate kinase